MIGHLIFKDGTTFEGISFGSKKGKAGEVVFSTGMAGYPESMTDPSYQGQILTLTYPIIGNYGVPERKYWESPSIKVSGLVVSNYNDTPSHHLSKRSLSQWLIDEDIPAVQIKDTRALTQKLRDEGSQLGKIVIENDVEFYDPNKENLVSKVSVKKISVQKAFSPRKTKNILYIDCGGKRNMISCLQRRGANVIVVPWDFNPLDSEKKLHELMKEQGIALHIDGFVVSNGPGDPKFVDKTIQTTKQLMETKKPILGICLGNQLLCLAGGGNTKKLKFGHRGQNGPCIMEGTNLPAGRQGRCYITTQNHGFAVSELPKGFKTWFTNANDGSNEGIIHTKLPFMSVQFHPEATPGPQDTEWIFDYFLDKIK
ncbi:MAG: glutamine-hydrolyzing carbamoyl-phosphate synthase small subunit [bacterium]|nr:glutamine-hydrolyzing carbamoyl-phosphate synthase small subunit [bacterium]